MLDPPDDPDDVDAVITVSELDPEAPPVETEELTEAVPWPCPWEWPWLCDSECTLLVTVEELPNVEGAGEPCPSCDIDSSLPSP